MGDVANMIIDGTLCSVCGCVMDDLIQKGCSELKEAPGYPRVCEECKGEMQDDPRVEAEFLNKNNDMGPEELSMCCRTSKNASVLKLDEEEATEKNADGELMHEDGETIIVPKDEYEKLVYAAIVLDQMEEMGIDETTQYKEAVKIADMMIQKLWDSEDPEDVVKTEEED